MTQKTPRQYLFLKYRRLSLTQISAHLQTTFSLCKCYIAIKTKGLCRLLGVVVDREGEGYAACADMMNTYYGYADIPIGLIRNGIKDPRVYIDYKPVISIPFLMGI